MTSKMQADGKSDHEAAPDGVNTATGGESRGGAYPRGDAADGEQDEARFPERGGQSDMGYTGPDNPNATTDPA